MSELSNDLDPDGPIPPDEMDELEAHEEAERAAADEVDEAAEHEAAAEGELARAHQDYFAVVFANFGPEDLPLPCPTCQSLGYVVTELRPDPSAQECPACAGLGVTLTGSKVDANVTRACPRCRGLGFTDIPAVLGEALAPPPAVTPDNQILPPEAFPLPTPVPAAVG